MQKNYENLKTLSSTINKHSSTKLKKTLSTHLNTSSSNADIYDIYSKFSKEFSCLNDLKTIEEKFPFKCQKEEYKKMINPLYNVHQEYKDKPKRTPKAKHSFKNLLLRTLPKKKTVKDDDCDGSDPELINQSPEQRFKKICAKLEKFNKIDFAEKKEFPFNASLMLKNKVSNGILILGSNNYKYKVENLEQLDVVINIIGEYPVKEFEKHKGLHFEEFHEKNCKEVTETIVVTQSGHCVNFYTKPNENFSSYHYLADEIHKHLWGGKRVLVHCQMGQIRSATLMLFYLRKYFFDNASEANEFIGLKRENAGAPSMLLENIEKLVKEKK